MFEDPGLLLFALCLLLPPFRLFCFHLLPLIALDLLSAVFAAPNFPLCRLHPTGRALPAEDHPTHSAVVPSSRERKLCTTTVAPRNVRIRHPCNFFGFERSQRRLIIIRSYSGSVGTVVLHSRSVPLALLLCLNLNPSNVVTLQTTKQSHLITPNISITRTITGPIKLSLPFLSRIILWIGRHIVDRQRTYCLTALNIEVQRHRRRRRGAQYLWRLCLLRGKN
mmetsp:Transcript_20199/g.42311  ORF Transcript_20199/g.42311 Transcript_20199/m.42311 type:complete len:223 (-) Transcript_20199:134-802(-)